MLRQIQKTGIFRLFTTTTSRSLCVLADHKIAEPKKVKKAPNPTIAAVFANLKDEDPAAGGVDSISETIANAKTVNGLLSIADTRKDLNRNHALKIVSILAEWTSINRTNLNEFENDARFTKLCRMLGKAVAFNKKADSEKSSLTESKTMINQDIDTILTIKGLDEASKLVASITVDQMVKVMKNLAAKKRRSTPLLNTIAFNLSGKEEALDLKQCSDVLFAMASLNFADASLISKVCNDIQKNLKVAELKKSSVVGSMLRSLALLKYRDISVLDTMAEWIVTNHATCRTQDIQSLCLSLAALNYMPIDLEDRIKGVMTLTLMDFKNANDYLSYVWSLIALNINNEKAFNEVLENSYIEKLRADMKGELTPAIKLKLLNINGAVKLFYPQYNGAMLDRQKHKEIYDISVMYSTNKQLLVKAAIDGLKSIVPDVSLRTNINTSMGFNIDAEFHIDGNGKLVPFEADYDKKIIIMCYDFHDYCQGSASMPLTGVSDLNYRLLKKSGQNVEILSVPHYEFSHNDLLLKRVQYLKKIIRTISKSI